MSSLATDTLWEENYRIKSVQRCFTHQRLRTDSWGGSWRNMEALETGGEGDTGDDWKRRNERVRTQQRLQMLDAEIILGVAQWPLCRAALHFPGSWLQVSAFAPPVPCSAPAPPSTHCSDGSNYTTQTFLLQQTNTSCKALIRWEDAVILSHPSDPHLPPTARWILNCRLAVLKLSDGLQTHRTHISRCPAGFQHTEWKESLLQSWTGCSPGGGKI